MNGSAPRGLAAGTGYLLFAWVATLGIARLTGAVAVLVVLGAAGVGALGAVISGWWRLARSRAVAVELRPAHLDAGADVFTVGDSVTVRVVVGSAGIPPLRPVHVCVLDRGQVVAAGWAIDGELIADGALTTRGRVDQFEVRLSSAGSAGLVWWRRRRSVAVDPFVVAPAAAGPGAHVTIEPGVQGDGSAGTPAGRAGGGEVDGVRPWRDGDADHTVHWPTSLRTGALAVFDHRREADARWLVTARTDTDDPDAEAGRVRWALAEGRRRGAAVFGVTPGHEPVELVDTTAIARWSATCVPTRPDEAPTRWAWLHRPVTWSGEPDDALTPRARWLVALSSAIALVMLAGALGSSAVVVAALVGGSVLTAAMTTGGTTHRSLAAAVKVFVATFTVAGLAAVVVSVSRADDLLSVISGPLPQVLMLLVVLHGFECTNRRAARASLAFGAVVAAYAIGQRVDPAVPTWMLAWAIAWTASLRAVAAPIRSLSTADRSVGARSATSRIPRRRSGDARAARRLTASALGLAVAAAATLGLLSVVTVPDGPARLGLPSALETIRPAASPSGIADADGGDTSTSATRDDGRRSGSAGGYPGFDHSLDTSMRGDLGDEIVMRVRAPEPDFWRGQTFVAFDGRRWSVLDDPGYLEFGPDITVPPTLGDVERSALAPNDEFLQTFYVEVDQPNILFAAHRPSRVLVEADLFIRSDGALRTNVTLTAGAVYTVISDRVRVDADVLARQGDVGERLTPQGREAFQLHLQVPESTSARTVELADRLAAESSSTFDLVRRMEAWIGANVRYDLDAPVPPEGVDAVDDLLFGSQLGFCEQIATALAVMLRTQGVPTRLATGYTPGDRDRVTGVWEVRASDAHAWVEVWFPETGWQAFDPTSSVPLAGESGRPSVGGDVIRSLTDHLRRHGRTLAVCGAALLVGAALVVAVRRRLDARRHRRSRGRWGLLQDRWTAAARARGIDDVCTNPELARRWSAADPAAAPAVEVLADRLDRAAFDPAFDTGDDARFAEVAELVETLERPVGAR